MAKRAASNYLAAVREGIESRLADDLRPGAVLEAPPVDVKVRERGRVQAPEQQRERERADEKDRQRLLRRSRRACGHHDGVAETTAPPPRSDAERASAV